MSEKIYDVPAEWAKRAWVDQAKYQEMYARSVSDPNGFWAEQGKRIGWMKPFTKVENTSFAPGNISIKWFEDGVLNVALELHRPASAHARRPDRHHLGGRHPSQSKHITYGNCTTRSAGLPTCCATATSGKGDRVTIYLPMIPEAAIAMLACARIGAIHSVVFGGFSPDSWRSASPTASPRSSSPPTRAARRQEGAAEGQRRCRARQVPATSSWVIVVKRTGAPST